VITYRRVHLSLPLRRRIPGGLHPYGGSAYWCLEKTLVHFVHGYLRQNPDYVRFFEHVFVPDELFFQTIIMNSELRDTVENDDLRYLDWSREPAPAVLTRGDLPALLESGQLFARKFDETVDSDVLDALDRRVAVE
jgi:hypothetical protein